MIRRRFACALSLLAAVSCGEVRPPSDAAATPRTSARPAAASVAGPGSAAPRNGHSLDAMHAEALRLYREQFCGTCHAFTPAGSAGIFGPPHDSMRVVAERRIREPDYRGTATTAQAYLRESLTDPAAYRVPGYERTRFLMPAYTQLDDAQLDALVSLLLDLPPADGGTP